MSTIQPYICDYAGERASDAYDRAESRFESLYGENLVDMAERYWESDEDWQLIMDSYAELYPEHDPDRDEIIAFILAEHIRKIGFVDESFREWAINWYLENAE